MKTLRFVLVAILAVAVVGGALAKTVTKDGITLPLTTKKVTFTWMMGDHPTVGPFDETKLCWKEFEKRTNVHIDFNCVPEANFKEKQAARLGTRDLPDMIRANLDIVKRFGPEGAFLPLEGLIAKTKVLSKLLTPEVRKEITAGDGHIYSIPGLKELRWSTGWLVREDWLKKLGLKEPTTLDEFYNMLVAFRDKDPDGNGKKDTTPLAICQELSGIVDKIAMAHGIRYEKALTPYMIDAKNKKVIYTPTTDQMKESLQYINKLYKEGLLDKQFASNVAAAVLQERMLNNEVAATLTHMTRIRDWNTFAETSGKIKGFHLIGLAPMKGPRGETGTSYSSSTNTSQAVAFNAKIKNPEIAMAWHDYRYSQEGILLNCWGIEGVTFNYVDGRPVWAEHILNDPQGRAATQVLGADYGLLMPNNPNYMPIVPEQFPKDVIDAWNKCKGTERDDFPPLPYTVEESQKIGSAMAAISPKQEEWMVQFMTGQKGFDQWDAFKAAMKQLGMDEVMKLVNAAYVRYLAS